ncbi:MAG: flagellar protein FlaG [Bacillota bacterium]|nr:flagellar protein FlaG [Bacillota bacterium]
MEVRANGQVGRNDYDLSQSNINALDKVNNIPSNNTSNNNAGETNSGTTGNNQGEVTEQDAKKAVEKLNKLLTGEATHAEYEVHEGFKDIIIKIVDNETKKVVTEIPPKKILDMMQKLCEMAGIIFDKKV